MMRLCADLTASASDGEKPDSRSTAETMAEQPKSPFKASIARLASSRTSWRRRRRARPHRVRGTAEMVSAGRRGSGKREPEGTVVWLGRPRSHSCSAGRGHKNRRRCRRLPGKDVAPQSPPPGCGRGAQGLTGTRWRRKRRPCPCPCLCRACACPQPHAPPELLASPSRWPPLSQAVPPHGPGGMAPSARLPFAPQLSCSGVSSLTASSMD